MTDFGRLMTAMVTPFDKDNNLYTSRAGKLADLLVSEQKSEALVVSGTTGETPTLSFDEKLNLFHSVVDRVGDKAAVIAGTGSYCTKDSITLTKEAEDIGVHGIMLVTPYYNKPKQDDLYYHFKEISDHTNLPIMLYNVPGRTGVDMEERTILKLAEIDNIVAIKEASGDFNKVTNICSKSPIDFDVYSGDDVSLLPTLSLGGKGVVSVASHIVGAEIFEIIEAYHSGDTNKALSGFQKLFPLFEALTTKTNPIPIKNMVNKHILEVGSVRPPLYDMTDEQLEKVSSIYQEVKRNYLKP